jgi:hypothetical protein
MLEGVNSSVAPTFRWRANLASGMHAKLSGGVGSTCIERCAAMNWSEIICSHVVGLAERLRSRYVRLMLALGPNAFPGAGPQLSP